MNKNNLTSISLVFFIVLLFAVAVPAAPGDLDVSFGQFGKVREGFGLGIDEANAVVIQSDSKVIVAGSIGDGFRRALGVIRYNPDGTRDTSFGIGGKVVTRLRFFEKVVAIRVQSGGKIVVGAKTLDDFALVRYNPDGSPDTSFDNDGIVLTDFSGSSEDVTADFVIQGSGKIVVVGSASLTGNPRHFAVLRYNADGSLDTSFDGDGKVLTSIGNLGEEATAVTLQDDGKILVAGYSRRIFGPTTVTDFVILRYLTNGALDTTFNTSGFSVIQMFGGDSSPTSIVFQKGNGTQSNRDKIIVGGRAISNGNSGFGVIRLAVFGALDTTFSGDGRALFFNAAVSSMRAMMTEGTTGQAHKIIVAGVTDFGGYTIARINSDGNSLDPTFDGDGVATVAGFGGLNAMAAQNGKIAVAGLAVSTSSGSDDFGIGQINGDGSADPTFDGDGFKSEDVGNADSRARGVAIQRDGKIVIVGDSDGRGATIGRYSANGSPDLSFGSGGFKSLNPGTVGSAVAIQTDGKIVISGSSSQQLMVARLNTNGSLDNTFDGDGIATTPIVGVGNAVLIQPDGKIVAAGSAGINVLVTRFNANGSPDNSFDTDGIVTTPFGSTAAASSVALQADGKIVAAGYNALNTTANDFAVARYETNGLLDTSFAGDGLVTASFGPGIDQGRAVVVQPDGKILVAGVASNGTDDDFAVIRFNPNGFPDPTFDGDGKVTTAVRAGDDAGNAMVLQPDGKLLVAGSSQSAQNVADFAVVRYNSNGSPDNSFWDSSSLYGSGGKVFADFTGDPDYAFGIALDSFGRAVIVGDGAVLFGAVRLTGDIAAGGPAPFDFDGDNKTDISIFRPTVGQWWYQRSSNGGVVAGTFGVSTDKIVPADYSGDGKTDIAIFRPSTGEWFVLRSEDSSFYSVPFGTNGDIPVPGDYDSDGKADIAVFRPSTNIWFINKSGGGTDIIGFGAAGDKPVVADYDGDGKTDIAIYRPGVGEWWIRRSLNQTVFALSFGTAGDKPVQGDYTGDGKADIAFWRPSNGNWYVLRSEDFSFFSFPFGANGDVPSPGDFDGDGRFDPSVFRPSGSTWFVNRSTAGILIATFGAPGDNPVPGAFVP